MECQTIMYTHLSLPWQQGQITLANPPLGMILGGQRKPETKEETVMDAGRTYRTPYKCRTSGHQSRKFCLTDSDDQSKCDRILSEV